MENTTENTNKKRLGRGLGSLLSGASLDAANTVATQPTSVAENDRSTVDLTKNQVGRGEKQIIVEKIVEQKIDEDKRIWQVAVDKCVPGQYQPRKKFDKDALNELAISIKENGILQPIVVRKRHAGGFEIIAGERRWRAAQIAGLHEVPALIKIYSDQEALQLALIENIQREDLDPVEEAESYQRLMDEFNLSQQQVAEKVGKERSTVANAVRLLALPFEIKNMIVDKLLSVGHAKILMSVDGKQDQMRLAKTVQTKNLSVRALEQLIKSEANKNKNTETQIKDMNMSEKLAQQLAQQVQKKLGTKTTIAYNNGKGCLTIHFYTDEQLNSIYERLTE